MDAKIFFEILQNAREITIGRELATMLTERGIDIRKVESFVQENPNAALCIFWSWQDKQTMGLKADLKTFQKMANDAPVFTELAFRSFYQRESIEDRDKLVFSVLLGKDYHLTRPPIQKVISEFEISEQCLLEIARPAFTLTSPQRLIARTFPFVYKLSRNIESSRLTLVSHASLFASLDCAPSFWGFIYGLLADGLLSNEQLSQVEQKLGKASWDLKTEARGWSHAILASVNRLAVFESISALLKQNEDSPNYQIVFFETMVKALNCFTDQKEAISPILDWLLANFHLDLARPHRKSLVECFDRILRNQSTLQLSPRMVMKMDSLLLLLMQEQIEDLQFWLLVDSYLCERLPLDKETGYFVLRNVIQLAEVYHSSYLSRVESFPSIELINQPEFAAQFQALVESNEVEDIFFLFTLFNRVFENVPYLTSKITSDRVFFSLIMAYRWRGASMEAKAARLFIEFLVINSDIETSSLQGYLVNEIYRTALSFKTACFDYWISKEWIEPTMYLALNQARVYFEKQIAIAGREALNFGFPGLHELEGIHELRMRTRTLGHSNDLNSILNVFSHVDVIYGNSFSGFNDRSSPAKMNTISYEFPLNRFLFTKPEGSDIISKNAFRRLSSNHE